MCELCEMSFIQSGCVGQCVVLCVPQERNRTYGVGHPSSSQDVLFCVPQERSRTRVSGVGHPSPSQDVLFCVFHRREAIHVVWDVFHPVRMCWSVCCFVFHRREAVHV